MESPPVKTVQLLGMTPALAQALGDPTITPAAVERAYDVAFGDHRELARQVIAQHEAHRERTGAPTEWGGFLAIDPTTRAVVGTCGFVDAPDADGCVEIAYFTFPPFEGKGWGTAMAAALRAYAAASGAARTVRAHTLPEPNASTRILERNGFVQVGDAVDHEVGRVWRWERPVGAPVVGAPMMA
jgi:ribosomal-protein-alanine N-acetyltransferase